MIRYPAIGFEVRQRINCGQFLKCSYLAIAAKLHRPLHCDRINESLLYYRDQCWSLCAWTVHIHVLIGFSFNAASLPSA